MMRVNIFRVAWYFSEAWSELQLVLTPVPAFIDHKWTEKSDTDKLKERFVERAFCP